MFQPYPLFVALRYLRARRRNRFATFVSAISIGGIALSVAALIIVLSVMNGFEREVTRHVLGMSAHAIMVAPDNALFEWQELIEKAVSEAGVAAASPYVRGSGMLSHKDEVRGVIVEGIDPRLEMQVTDVGQYIGEAQLARLAGPDNPILLGRTLADELDVGSGDSLTLVVPEWDESGNPRSPRYARLRIAGIFHVGMHQYDGRLLLMQLDAAQKLFKQGTSVSGIRVRFDHADSAPLGIRHLVQKLDENLGVLDWTQYHRNFFLALKSQKRIMFIILVLIIAVAAFNIAANMVMVVAEKIRDIAILRTLGATRMRIVALFLLQGLLIGISGATLGALLGAWGARQSEAVAALIESTFHIDLINSQVYFIDYLPADLHAPDVIAVTSASIALSLLATLYPAFRAASINPADGVHRD